MTINLLKSYFTLFLLLLGIVSAHAQNVGIHTNTPTVEFHVVAKNSKVQNGSAELNTYVNPGLNSITSSEDFRLIGPKLSLRSDKVNIGLTMDGVQALNVEGAIQVGNSSTGSDGSIKFINNGFYGFSNGDWRPMLSTFIYNDLKNLVSTRTNYNTYDFMYGSTDLPEGLFDDNMLFFDESKSALRVGALTGNDNWADANVGEYSVAAGLNTKASGWASFSMGEDNASSGLHATTFGKGNTATGDFSLVVGEGNTAPSIFETIFGRYAEVYVPLSGPDTWKPDDRLFVVANGDASTPNNLLTLYKGGDAHLDGEFLLGDEYNSPSVILSELLVGGDKKGEIRIKNESSSHSQDRGIEISTNGSNDEPYITMYDINGSPSIVLDVDVSGDSRITTDEISIKGGSDFAENFDISATDMECKPGMLVSIDPAIPGKLALTNERMDKKVVGIISGANGVETGLFMGQEGSIADGDYPIALAGRVYVYANEEGGTIAPGDFLTSSSQTGYAMKAQSQHNSWGTIIGKAMTPIDENGFVLVLVNLQ